MKKNHLILCESDFEALTNYCSTSNNALGAHNQEKLMVELSEAKVVARDNLPLNVVATNSKVLIWNMTKGQTFTVHIVSQQEMHRKDHRISVYDSLAIALLGYATGSIVEWELGDGLNRLQVMSVTQLNTETSNH
ncbi:GreA/GreB family elongation factor [Pedobacter sp. SYSU D00535]|uniref:GreA/GreB family elongation factor n=1 Tax=Pedobacter sp. SYSU D00535 TaxID=2810308 RepID=UPI001A974AAD|nr:GreA/GreB family elongation factor [Pedobacter sp. SYSU D00535]